MAVDSISISLFYNDVEKEEEDQEEYIDMEVSSYNNLFCNSNSNEFEFQMFSSSSDRELTTTSPADELFYKGKLLPLHLPPRLQMVEKLLQDKNMDTFDEFFSTPLDTSPFDTPMENNTPLFRSCNVSPSVSCHVSRELNPEDYFLDTTATTTINKNPKKFWTSKLTLTKQSIKASRDYLRSFFSKQSSSHESKNKISRSGGKKKEKLVDGNNGGKRHRRSFSYAMKRFSTTNMTNSLLSSSSDCNELMNRGSEIESQIQSAIAHCKRSSEQQLHSRKTVSDVGFCSLAASRIVCDDQERQVLCRG